MYRANVDTSRGKRHVWTTFSADQVDLNFAEPEVLVEFIDILLFFVARGAHPMLPGQVDFVSPRIGDIHRVSNAREDTVAVSIHVYGANIGAVRRHVYAEQTGEPSPFVSGYTNDVEPDLWDRSAEA